MSDIDGSSIASTLNELKDRIWTRRPVLGEIMQRHGNDTLCCYAKDFLDVNKSPLLDARKNELIEVVEELLAARLNPKVAQEVATQLRHLPLVSTADHHSPVQHPFWINANIISGLPYFEKNDPLLNYLVVFSFASVSINNASGYARGVMFHNHVNGDGEISRLPLLPDREKMGTVYGMRAFTREELDKAKNELIKKEKTGSISAGRGTALAATLERYLGTDTVLNSKDLDEQITKINFQLWPDLFATDSKVATPGLIYLEIETIVTELLLRKHLTDTSSLIYRVLFDEEYQPLVRKFFNNIPGAFSFEHDWGTYLFWARDDKQHRVRMFLSEGKLHSTYRQHLYDMTPEAIAAALKNKELFPSMMLCYLIVSLYYGMKCLGGFCQVNDLTVTKLAWEQLLRAIGETNEAAAVEPVQTKELGGDGMVLSYLKKSSGDIVTATGFDMLLSPHKATFADFLAIAERVTLNEMMLPMLPEMYTVLYAQKERDPRLTALTSEEIIKIEGLKEKVFLP